MFLNTVLMVKKIELAARHDPLLTRELGWRAQQSVEHKTRTQQIHRCVNLEQAYRRCRCHTRTDPMPQVEVRSLRHSGQRRGTKKPTRHPKMATTSGSGVPGDWSAFFGCSLLRTLTKITNCPLCFSEFVCGKLNIILIYMVNLYDM